MTDEARRKREQLSSLITKNGFKSIRQVCELADVSNANVYSNLYGTFDMSIKRIFKLANVIGCDITELIEIFYPDLYAENQNRVAEKLREVPVEDT